MAKVPRNFRLMDEYENSLKGVGDARCTFGLAKPDDVLMTVWNGTIIGSGDDKSHEPRFYELKMHCGPDYPDKPPQIRFISQVNMPCVNPNGDVDLSKVDKRKMPCLADWKTEYSLDTVLGELRRYMESSAVKSLPQPPRGATYPERNDW